MGLYRGRRIAGVLRSDLHFEKVTLPWRTDWAGTRINFGRPVIAVIQVKDEDKFD